MGTGTLVFQPLKDTGENKHLGPKLKTRCDTTVSLVHSPSSRPPHTHHGWEEPPVWVPVGRLVKPGSFGLPRSMFRAMAFFSKTVGQVVEKGENTL